ncbi:MAG TPA: DUF1552 domain-containing protein [Polyangiaceae bacterium]|nr:DUF1552 domain-containing protein [Polyangiaceae bacterium]
MSSYKVSRRALLRSAGASAALLWPLIRNIEAHAEGAKAPLRLLIIHHPLGTAPGGVNWVPQGVTGTSTSFTLPLESAPFAPLQNQMVMIDGLNLITASKMAGGNNGGQNTHEGGMVAMMTGVPTLGVHGQQDHCAGGPSIDQLLLAQSTTLGGTGAAMDQRTPFGHLALAADIRSDRDEIAPRILSYKAPVSASDISLARQPIYPETQPLNTYGRLFGKVTGMDSSALLAQKLSVLDFMRGDLARLNKIIPASEKDRLAAHTIAIQSLEASLRQSYGGASTNPQCITPAMPPNYATVGETGDGKIGGISTASSNLSGVDYYPGIANCTPSAASSCYAHQDVAMNQLRMIKAAFACDYVRVATFMYSAGTNWVVFPSTFGGSTISSAALGNNGKSTPHHPPSHTDDAPTHGWLNQINKFYSQMTADALKELSTTPDVDGNMLLDNTIVVYLTEVARAWDHNQQNMPLILFGGKNTGLKGGTFLKVSGGKLPGQTGGSSNRPFNDMWLALAPKFGVTLPSLGASTQWTGPLSGIFA